MWWIGGGGILGAVAGLAMLLSMIDPTVSPEAARYFGDLVFPFIGFGAVAGLTFGGVVFAVRRVSNRQ